MNGNNQQIKINLQWAVRFNTLSEPELYADGVFSQLNNLRCPPTCPIFLLSKNNLLGRALDLVCMYIYYVGLTACESILDHSSRDLSASRWRAPCLDVVLNWISHGPLHSATPSRTCVQPMYICIRGQEPVLVYNAWNSKLLTAGKDSADHSRRRARGTMSTTYIHRRLVLNGKVY